MRSSRCFLLNVYHSFLITGSGKGHFLIMDMLTFKENFLASFYILLSLNRREKQELITKKTFIKMKPYIPFRLDL
jgi:hypothetical protein